MNVFYIPSWYPEPHRSLLNGVFFAETALAITSTDPNVRLFVSRWGQGERELSSARLRHWWRDRRPIGVARPERSEVRSNLIEWMTPAWTWRYELARGNIDAIVEANRRNLALARAEAGTIDVIHAQVSFPAGYVAMRLSAESGIPYVISEHMGPFPFRHFVRGGQVVADVALPLRQARRVTAVSRSLARSIEDSVGVRAQVVPNGINTEFFSPGPPRSGPFVFLTVGHLEHQKGIDVLLHAIARLGATPDVRFRFAGDGSQAATYRALAGSLGISGCIDWLGALDRAGVRDAMRACDCFVLASRHESFGIVYVEALATGKPVIATRSGGPEDLVHEGNGMLVPVEDVEALAEALRAMRARAREYDAAAIRADAVARFSAARVARRFVALYHEVSESR